MKKLYNKALMFQSLYNGKWALLAGILFMGIVSYSNINSRMNNLRESISSLTSDRLDTFDFSVVVAMCLILFGTYVIITGFNKRNTQTFLISGPYTREEIKKNEVLVSFLALILLIVTFLYINLCVYYRERELLSLTTGYFKVLGVDFLRLVILGSLFISYITLMDMLFSNTIVTIIAMIILPIVGILDLGYFSNLSRIFLFRFDYIGNIYLVLRRFGELVFYGEFLVNDFNIYIPYIIGLILINIVIFLIIFRVNRNLTINKMSKFFTFPIAEKGISWLLSFSPIFIIMSIQLDKYIMNKGIYFYAIHWTLGLLIVIVFVGLALLISYFINKFLMKIIKNYI